MLGFAHDDFFILSAMDLKALRYFLTLARTGSFIVTARQHEVPASSVSRFIAALEREIGQQLVFRSTRAVRLTEAGARFEIQVRDAVEQLDAAAGQLAVKDADVEGVVRVNAPQAFGRMHLAKPLHDLQMAYPKLSMELTLTDVFVDPVQEGADIVLRIGTLLDSGLIGNVIGPSRYLIAASPAYLAKQGVPMAPEELVAHNCLLYKGLYGTQKWYFRQEAGALPKQQPISGKLHSNSAETLVAAALAGQGIVLFPTWLLLPCHFTDGKLIRLLPDWEASSESAETFIQILSPENRLRSQRVRRVSEFLISSFGSPPCWDQR